MPNREKVVKELDKIAGEANPWKESPPLRCDLPYPLLLDAIELLKEQEAIEPKRNSLSPTDWFCGKCGMCISRFHDYCPSCGRAVKWE